MSIRNRLTALFVMVIVLPLVIALLYLYSSGLEGDRKRLENNAIEQIGASIERDLQIMSSAADMLASNPTVRQYLSIPTNEQIVDEQFDEMLTLRSIVSIIDQRKPIFAVRLFVAQDKMYTADRINLLDMDLFLNNPHFANASVRTMFTPVYTNRYLGQGTQEILSCVRLITHTRRVTEQVGGVAIDMQAEHLAETMRAWQSERLVSIALMDENGGVILSDGVAKAPSRFEYLVERKIAGTQWRLSAVFRSGLARFFPSGGGVALPVGMYIVAAALMMLLISLLIVRKISSRIGRMVETFTDAEPKAEKPSSGIFSSLDHAMDEAHLMIVRQQTQAREALEMELRLLQAQINPHFLYNTLDSIGWMIQGNRTDAATEAIIALARYLRIALSKGADVIRVCEEVDMAQLYAAIQQRRLEDSFTIECDVEAEAESCLLPKMTLQPIIENAILHGKAKHISVYVYTEADALVLSVTDDGMGMDEQSLAAMMQRKADPSHGYGIYNVNKRIRLFSGEKEGFGLEAESEAGKYTSFIVRVARVMADSSNE